MILEKYRDSVSAIDDLTGARVFRELRDPWPEVVYHMSLFDALASGGHSQADLVLVLLHMETRVSIRYVEGLLGHRIRVCPPALARAPSVVRDRPRVRDDRRVTHVFEFQTRGKRRLLVSPIYRRLELIRVGLSLTQLYAKGLRQKDIRIALRRGWIRLESESRRRA